MYTKIKHYYFFFFCNLYIFFLCIRENALQMKWSCFCLWNEIQNCLCVRVKRNWWEMSKRNEWQRFGVLGVCVKLSSAYSNVALCIKLTYQRWTMFRVNGNFEKDCCILTLRCCTYIRRKSSVQLNKRHHHHLLPYIIYVIVEYIFVFKIFWVYIVHL